MSKQFRSVHRQDDFSHIVGVAAPRRRYGRSDRSRDAPRSVYAHRPSPGRDARISSEAVDHRHCWRGCASSSTIIVAKRADHHRNRHSATSPARCRRWSRRAQAASPCPVKHRSSSPPSWRMATSNDTRVRVEGLSKIIASIFPASGFFSPSARFLLALLLHGASSKTRSSRATGPSREISVRSTKVPRCRWLSSGGSLLLRAETLLATTRAGAIDHRRARRRHFLLAR